MEHARASACEIHSPCTYLFGFRNVEFWYIFCGATCFCSLLEEPLEWYENKGTECLSSPINLGILLESLTSWPCGTCGMMPFLVIFLPLWPSLHWRCDWFSRMIAWSSTKQKHIHEQRVEWGILSTGNPLTVSTQENTTKRRAIAANRCPVDWRWRTFSSCDDEIPDYLLGGGWGECGRSCLRGCTRHKREPDDHDGIEKHKDQNLQKKTMILIFRRRHGNSEKMNSLMFELSSFLAEEKHEIDSENSRKVLRELRLCCIYRFKNIRTTKVLVTYLLRLAVVCWCWLHCILLILCGPGSPFAKIPENERTRTKHQEQGLDLEPIFWVFFSCCLSQGLSEWTPSVILRASPITEKPESRHERKCRAVLKRFGTQGVCAWFTIPPKQCGKTCASCYNLTVWMYLAEKWLICASRSWTIRSLALWPYGLIISRKTFTNSRKSEWVMKAVTGT